MSVMDKVSMEHDTSALSAIIRSLDISDRKQEVHEAQFDRYKTDFEEIIRNGHVYGESNFEHIDTGMCPAEGSSEKPSEECKTARIKKYAQDDLLCKRHEELSTKLTDMQTSWNNVSIFTK